MVSWCNEKSNKNDNLQEIVENIWKYENLGVTLRR
jgi:hypothetical protein